MGKLVAAAVAALVSVALMPPLSAHAATEPARVLIVGDSVTQGGDGSFSWRYFAWHQLAAGSVDFVGPRRATRTEADVYGGSYADPDFDQDHAARWGQALWQPLDYPDDLSPAVGDLIADHDPDVVVEALGVNDLAWINMAPSQLAQQVRRYVAQARAAKPDVDVVIGGVPQEWIAGAAQFNDMLPSLAAELSTEASRVVAAAVPDFVRGVDTYDIAHPTRMGEEKLGASYAAAIASLLPAPAPEPVPVPTTTHEPAPAPVPPPAPAPAPTQPAPTTTAPAWPATLSAPGTPRKVKAVRKAPKRIVVTWRAGKQAEHYVVRCGRTEKTSAGLRAVLRSRVSTCAVRAVNAAGVSGWSKVRVTRG